MGASSSDGAVPLIRQGSGRERVPMAHHATGAASSLLPESSRESRRWCAVGTVSLVVSEWRIPLISGGAPFVVVEELVMDTLSPSPPLSLRPSLLTGRSWADQLRLVEAFIDAWEAGVIAPERLRTGCLYEGQPASTYGIAVLRYDPRRSGRRQIPFHAWWPELAPSAPLLTAYRTMDRHGQRALSWRDFARSYLTELEAVPTSVLLNLVATLCQMPCRYKTVTFLGCEHAAAADEQRVRCHRRLLRAWLLGQQVPDVER
jgi:uncharacterized protein YeaO (DUF488 family)